MKARANKTNEPAPTVKAPAPEEEVVDAGAEPEDVALPDKVKLTVVTAESKLDGMVPLMEVGAVPLTRKTVMSEGWFLPAKAEPTNQVHQYSVITPFWTPVTALIWNRLAKLVLPPPARVEVLDNTTNPGTASLTTPGANFGSVKLSW